MASVDPHVALPPPPVWIPAQPPDLTRVQRATREVFRRAAEPLATPAEARTALDAVAAATCELIAADRAALLIRADARWVLVSMWGDLRWPIGLRGMELVRMLDRSVASSASHPLLEHGREIGRLWVGRAQPRAFTSDQCDALRTLADMTSLILHHQAAEAPHDEPVSERCTTVPPPVERVLSVPSFPPALARIMAVADGDDPTALRDALALDPALAAKALKLASSPAMGRAHVVRSLDEALVVLGQRGVRNLALMQFGRALFARWTAADRLLWEHALGTAVGMQAVLERQDPPAAEDAFLCGLLHDVARIALHNSHPGRYERVLVDAAAGGKPWQQLEVETFGSSALALLPDLIADWVLPPRVASTLHELARNPHPSSRLHAAFAWAAPTALRLCAGWRQHLGERAEPTWLREQITHAADAAHIDPVTERELQSIMATRSEALRRLLG